MQTRGEEKNGEESEGSRREEERRRTGRSDERRGTGRRGLGREMWQIECGTEKVRSLCRMMKIELDMHVISSMHSLQYT